MQTRRIRIADILVSYADATQDVRIERSLLDVWNGKPGLAQECMNAQCILRRRKDFPHAVLAASVMKSRVYIFDRPDHVVRYIISEHESQLIDDHDRKRIGSPGVLVLRAPMGIRRSGVPHSGSRTRPSSPGRHRILASGERARLLAAADALERASST